MSKDLIMKYVASFFKGVRPGWKRILFSPEVKPSLNRAIMSLSQFLYNKGIRAHHLDKNGLKTYLRPNEFNIFEFLKYCDPQNVSAIIVGQDPYTRPDEAHGLSFSVPKKAGIPHSLRAIYDTLLEYKLIETMPTHGNLINWAKQGILLINRYLTRSPNIQSDGDAVWINGNGDSSSVHQFWIEFTDTFLQYLTGEFLKKQLNHPAHKLYVLLWGNVAKSAAASCNTTDLPPGVSVQILEWGHPSPANSQNMTADNPLNFRKCPHFAILHQELGINWDPDFDSGNKRLSQFYLAKTFDGFDLSSQLNNADQYDDATDTKENIIIRGSTNKMPAEVPPKIPAPLISKRAISNTPIIIGTDGGCSNNGKINAIGSYGVYFHKPFWQQPTKIWGCLPHKILVIEENTSLIHGGDEIKPTNSRGELYGAIYALKQCIQELNMRMELHPVIIIMDSTYVLHMINERIWRTHAKDPELSARTVEANNDLVKIIYKLLLELAQLVPTNDSDLSPWDILMQPAAHNNFAVSKKKSNPMDTKWGGLTIIHQNSHQAAPSADKDEYLYWLCNNEADQLCNKAVSEYNPLQLGPFTA
jgi:uracil-DNA glycosylase